MNINPRIGLNFGWFIDGIMVTTNAAVQDMVISAKKKFLAQKTGLHENG